MWKCQLPIPIFHHLQKQPISSFPMAQILPRCKKNGRRYWVLYWNSYGNPHRILRSNARTSRTKETARSGTIKSARKPAMDEWLKYKSGDCRDIAIQKAVAAPDIARISVDVFRDPSSLSCLFGPICFCFWIATVHFYHFDAKIPFCNVQAAWYINRVSTSL